MATFKSAVNPHLLPRRTMNYIGLVDQRNATEGFGYKCLALPSESSLEFNSWASPMDVSALTPLIPAVSWTPHSQGG